MHLSIFNLKSYLSDHYFRPLGQLAERDIYFANVFFLYLARSAKLPTYFTFRNFLLVLNGDKLSQDSLDRFSRPLHQMIGVSLNMTDLDLFFNSSKDVATATN